MGLARKGWPLAIDKNPASKPLRRSRMHYFVTGATGFIGKRLVKKLLARRGSTVHFLMREASADKLPKARPDMPVATDADRLPSPAPKQLKPATAVSSMVFRRSRR